MSNLLVRVTLAIIGFMVMKNAEWAEIDPNDPNIKFKYRVVFRGNDVRDQNFDVAMFQDLGSSASSMDASRSCDMYGCLPGHTVEQADAEQAYLQATFPKNAIPTWVCLPKEAWILEWIEKGMKRPVVQLLRPLYGHPHAAAHWDNFSDEAIRKKGFEPVPGENWPSVYFHKDLRLLLVRYVDDLKMSGPKENMVKGWTLIQDAIEIGDVEPIGLFLGCKHEPVEITQKWHYSTWYSL